MEENNIEEIFKRQNIRGIAQDEFDAFIKEWVKKYNLPDEAKNGLCLLMGAYLMAFGKSLKMEECEVDHSWVTYVFGDYKECLKCGKVITNPPLFP